MHSIAEKIVMKPTLRFFYGYAIPFSVYWSKKSFRALIHVSIGRDSFGTIFQLVDKNVDSFLPRPRNYTPLAGFKPTSIRTEHSMLTSRPRRSQKTE
jgi:hypothetical protein